MSEPIDTPQHEPATSASATPFAASTPGHKPENLWLNLVCNIVLPAVILSNLSSEKRLGPLWALVVGLAFPLGYGIYDLIKRRKWNLFSIVGVVNVSISGGMGLAGANGKLFAIKDAALPAIFAVAAVATLRTRRPLVREMLFNDTVIDVPRVEAALEARGAREEFEKLLASSTWFLAGGFVMSAVLNYVLARMILKSPSPSPEFTAELGKMHWISLPVIMVPFMGIALFLLWRLFGGVERLTGLKTDDILRGEKKQEKA